MANNNCQYSTRYCWDADKVKALIRLRAELSPLFTGKRNASKYAWAVVERELNVPLPLSKIIKKWNNLLQEYKAIKISEEPKRREWPFFTLMDVYFSDQVNDPSLRLFSSTKTLKESLDESVFDDDPIIASAIAAATSGACMEIEDLLKRQKERRANEAKYVSDQITSSKATDYSISGNKSNVITVKDNNFIYKKKENTNNMKLHPDQQTVVKNENISNSRPVPQKQLPTPPPTPKSKYPDNNTIDQYLLSWNNFLGNMSRGFHTLQKDEKMVDVTIAAGGKIFKAHKLVLSVCSPYFQEIFLENPSNHPILLMADVEANHMAGLLNFMYSGQVNVKYEDLPVFLKVAEAMKIKGLHTEKPEGQNLKEIQFSRDDSSADFHVVNSSANTIPVDITEQSFPSPLLKGEDGTFHASLHSSGQKPSLEPFHHSIKTVSFEDGHNKFSILKPNACKKILDHSKQQKYLAKRKIFVQCESDWKEKRKPELAEKEQYNNSQSNLSCMSQVIPKHDDYFNDEILNLAPNGVSNNTLKCLPIKTGEKTKSCQYNQTTFTEIRKSNRLDINFMDEEVTYVPKICEDGNNNICKDGLVCNEKKQVNRNEPENYNNDNITYDNGAGPDSNINNSSDSKNKNPNIKQQIIGSDDNNNNYPNESSETKSCGRRKQADNNNNLFITSNSTPDLKENEIDASGPPDICSSPY